MLIRRPRLVSSARPEEGGELLLGPPAPRDASRLRRLAESRPSEHVHVAALIDGALVGVAPRLLVVKRGGLPAAVAARHRGLAVAVDPDLRQDPAVLSALARAIARLAGHEDVLFGPRTVIAPLLERAGSVGLAVVEVRDQILMTLPSEPREPAPPPGWRLRRARPEDHRWLLRAHAAMCREDLGVDQVSGNLAAYRRYFRDLIRAGASHVGERWDRPVFKAETPVESRSRILLEGVYTVPSERCAGCAGAAVAQLGREALRRNRKLCLYVQAGNDRARRLYRRLGFEPDGFWVTAVLRRRRGAWPAGPSIPAAGRRGA
ncbi:MAG: GNAT family N-acetyltransferase [Acidobacteria bacterium]|nr:MAG: GNAT family N-acetyltransferase [Acidobacteriota bacterium]